MNIRNAAYASLAALTLVGCNKEPTPPNPETIAKTDVYINIGGRAHSISDENGDGVADCLVAMTQGKLSGTLVAKNPDFTGGCMYEHGFPVDDISPEMQALLKPLREAHTAVVTQYKQEEFQERHAKWQAKQE